MSPPPGTPPTYPQAGYPPPGQVPGMPPGYAPHMGMPLAPPKKSNTGLIIAVVVVIVVVVLVAIPMMLYLMVAGLGPVPVNQQPPTAILQGGGSWSMDSTTATYTFTVSTVVPSSADVNPTDLMYIVSNAQSTTLYSGAAGQNTASGGFTINVLFNDALDAGRMSAGDRVQITVSPTANNPLVGGSLRVNFDGNSISTAHM